MAFKSIRKSQKEKTKASSVSTQPKVFSGIEQNICLPSAQHRRKLVTQLFDAAFYMAHYPDVSLSGLEPLYHYMAHGGAERRTPHPLFDPEWYLSQMPGEQLEYLTPVEHYLMLGWRKEYSPHPLFDVQYYLFRYPDVANAGLEPLSHYLANGSRELRCPSPLFDSEGYAKQILQRKASCNEQTFLEHYLETGWHQGLIPHSLFDAEFYLSQLSSKSRIDYAPLYHYARYGVPAGLSPHPLFNVPYYNEQCESDVLDPVKDYLVRGAEIGIDPHPCFSTQYYQEQYKDVTDKQVNPLIHFITRGAAEGRSPHPSFPSAWIARRFHHLSETEEQRLFALLFDDASLKATAPCSLAEYLYWHSDQPAAWVLTDPRIAKSTLNNIQKDAIIHDMIEELRELLALRRPTSSPEVSILIPAHNQIIHTLCCIRSILYCNTRYTYEILIADDASSDETSNIFNELQGTILKYYRSETQLGFVRNCNRAALLSSATQLVLLNNDTIVLPSWLDELVDTLANPHIGLVGSKLIYPTGLLQEAGCVIWNDGTGWNYGSGDDPCAPEYNVLKNVDYCSGASIAISKDLWNKTGGFNELYAPAYYEDTELAFRIRELGLGVLYQPLSCVVHFEGASHGCSTEQGIKHYQTINRVTFVEQWKQCLQYKDTPPSAPCRLKFSGTQKTILVIDACTPTPDRDSGSIDTEQYLKVLLADGYRVIFIAQNCLHEGRYTRNLQRLGIECHYTPYVKSISQLIASIGADLDAALIFRHYVAKEAIPALKLYAPQAKLILQTVDLHYLREQREAELADSVLLRERAIITKREELDIISRVDTAIVLSPHEHDILRSELPNAHICQIPILREPPLPVFSPPEKQKHLVFVGGFRHPPNVDALLWFHQEVWPLVLKTQAFQGQLLVVGGDAPEEIQKLASPRIKICGHVSELRSIFEMCRASVAPLRYGAGLKGKVITSLSYGLPCVTTSIGVEGTTLQHEKHVLVADNADDMATCINILFENHTLHTTMANNGRRIFIDMYSTSRVGIKITALLEKILCRSNDVSVLS